jgi:DNA mismatch repair protein MutS2
MIKEMELKTFPDDILKKLDFPTILEKLENLCRGSLGVENIQQQTFSNQTEWIQKAVQQVVEMKEIILNDANFPENGFDVLPFLGKISIQGASLAEYEFVKVAKFLNTFHDILNFFSSKKREGVYPALESLVKEIYWDKALMKEIDRVIDRDLEIVKETASPELGMIRRKMLEVEREQLSVFAKIVRKYRNLGYLADQDEGVRNARKVLAVRAEFKRSIPGIYHDDSSNGSIAFIEPQETVLLNNELTSFQREERREIEKILRQLTEYIGPYLKHFKKYLEILSIFDATRAKSFLAIEMNASAPIISKDGNYQLFHFRHPLLYLNYKKQKRKVVENNLILEVNERILLISGPNAGGKSIVLKSAGLIQLMFQFGMMIPADEGSKLLVYDNLFVDIGDSQSVENDLSTYSSHLRNMKYFTENSSPKTLVLLDELGHGTDPILGGAMAESVMDALLAKEVYAVVTTHYANLKAWGARTEGVQNGAMSFDQQHLEPIYQLNIGSPGSSFTFEIAAKSGLSSTIIQAAKSKIGEQNKEMELSLTEIQHEKQYVKGIRKALQLREKQVEILQKTYEQLKKDIEKEKKLLMKSFKEKALEEFNASNRELEKLMRDFKEDKQDKTKFLQTRKFIDQKREDFEKEHVAPIELQEVVEEISGKMDIGSLVKLNEGAEVGNIVEIRKNKAVVSFGNFTSLVNLDKLQLATAQKSKTHQVVLNTAQKMSEKAAFNTNLDLRGKMKDEALSALDNFLDYSMMYGHHRVRIIHGRGTGAIRQAVHFSLKTQPSVLHFEFETQESGGDGVTVVDLK